MIIRLQTETQLTETALNFILGSIVTTGGCSIAIHSTPEGYVVGNGSVGKTFPVSILDNPDIFKERVKELVSEIFTLDRSLSSRGRNFDGLGFWRGDDGI